MNWGKKILIVYLAFVAGIVFLVAKSVNQSQDLVAEDYYQQELQYQKRIDEAKRAENLKEPFMIGSDKEKISIRFSDIFMGRKIKGTAWVYCADDKRKDLTISFELPVDSLAFNFQYPYKGFRQLKLNWQVDTITYYKEQRFFIN